MLSACISFRTLTTTAFSARRSQEFHKHHARCESSVSQLGISHAFFECGWSPGTRWRIMRIMRSVSNCRLQRASAVGEINYCGLQPCHPWRMHCLSPKPVVLDTSWRLRRARMHLMSILDEDHGQRRHHRAPAKEGLNKTWRSICNFPRRARRLNSTCVLLRYGEKGRKKGLQAAGSGPY